MLGKRLLPPDFSAHATMDRLCVWFLRRFVSTDAVSLLIRHFVIETNVLNFCVRNDFGMLEVPAVDPEPRSRRLLRLDVQTALRLMNIPFALCLTREEYRRAVHSLRLDTSLLTVLTTLTGDAAFLGWRSAILPLRVDGNMDVPLTVYEHAVLCEYAHARLSKLTNGPTGPA